MTGYRVKTAGKYVTEDRFMLTYGDAVADVKIDKIINYHKEMNTIGTVTGVYPPSRFGDLIVNNGMVTKFKEKKKDIDNQMPINGGFLSLKKNF